MKLTIKEDNFCLEYVKSGNASEAYRLAYNVSKMSEAAINVEACNMLKKPNISLRIEQLRKPVVEAAQLTLEKHLDDLKRLRDDAWASEKYAAAIQAEISRGKASGLYIERVEKGTAGDFQRLSDEQLLQKASELEKDIDALNKAKAIITKAKDATKA